MTFWRMKRELWVWEHFVIIRFPQRREQTWLCTIFVLWNLDWKSNFTMKQMMEKEVPLHRLFPYHRADFTFGVAKECGPCRKRPKSPKALLHAQQAELSALTVTVFPALSFLHPAAVPLLSTSQISNDRRVCASCTKRACLWQLSHHLEAVDDWRPAQVRRDPQASKKTLQWITHIEQNKESPLNLLMSSFVRIWTGKISGSIGWIKPSIKCIFGDPWLT